jgi:ubiquinone/menaquinone biosynthesis C-methylase UbiE
VLILGDGDGRFLARFARANLEARIDSVDLSARMLALAALRLEQIPHPLRVRLIHADALTTDQLRGPYDLVVANFFLDCLDDPAQHRLLDKLSPNLAPRARWLLTDFRIVRSSWATLILRLFTKIMYLFFRATTNLTVRALTDFSPLLSLAGWHRVKQNNWLVGYLFSEIWETSNK